MATVLGGRQLDLRTSGLEFHLDQYNYSSGDIVISLTRRRRDHRCDSSLCDPIASATDLVSAGATAHHHTESHTFPGEGFRAASIPKKRSMCSQYISEQRCVRHDASWPCPRRHSRDRMIEGRRRRRTSALKVYFKIHW